MRAIFRNGWAYSIFVGLFVIFISLNALAVSGISCPTGTKPAGGWPLVFAWNGNCYKAVGTGSLAGDATTQLLATKKACTAVISYGDIHRGSDIDAMIRTKVIPLINNNRSTINAQKIGGIGFSAGGGIASYFGTVWASGIDPANGTNNNFRVAAILSLYGPLRMDRSTATDSLGNVTGGGGLFYLHENRSVDRNVDIPGIRQWNNPNCFCAGRGTSPCQCDVASTTYLNAYLNPSICAMSSQESDLVSISPAAYIEDHNPTHIAALYLCGGWKDSNVDYDENLLQAQYWWQDAYRQAVRVDDGHGFPLSSCTSAATTQGLPLPLTWLLQKLNLLGNFPPAA